MATAHEEETCSSCSATGNSYLQASTSDIVTLDVDAIERSSSIVTIFNMMKLPTVADITCKQK